MRRAARSDLTRALPPMDAMRLFSGADSRSLRARPPRLPSALAICDAFIVCTLLSAKHNGQARTGSGRRGSDGDQVIACLHEAEVTHRDIEPRHIASTGGSSGGGEESKP